MDKKIITFDFDRTLCFLPREQSPWGGESVPFEFVIDEFWRLRGEGHSVNILTTRMDATMETVHLFVREHGLLVDNIWNTSFLPKADYLVKHGLHTDWHFDDNPEEFYSMEKHKQFENTKFTFVYYDYGPPRFIDMRNLTEEDHGNIWRYIRG